MTDHTDEELIALAKKCGANRSNNLYDDEIAEPTFGVLLSDAQLRSFASYLRQQDMARMARMREALNAHDAWHREYDDFDGYPKSELQTITEAALSETADIQAWMDGQRAQWQPIETAAIRSRKE